MRNAYQGFSQAHVYKWVGYFAFEVKMIMCIKMYCQFRECFNVKFNTFVKILIYTGLCYIFYNKFFFSLYLYNFNSIDLL